MKNHLLNIVLASGSVYRKELLERLNISFCVEVPSVDETPLSDESPDKTAERLASAKSSALKKKYDNGLIIGSDQVASCDNRQLGKPISFEHAVDMLRFLSGRKITFYTALSIVNTRSNFEYQYTDRTVVTMRKFNDEVIHRYLELEPDALYCSGACKSESLGMILIDSIKTEDPTALIGLPMLKLIEIFLKEGVSLL